ncbi:hypothetical protein E5S34_22590 [Escherichia coli]|nr:replication protein C, IncQ-type [Escherichia coli]TGH93470.1 hypothetical protein E5S34_22590 [Escherichia coli]
MKPKNKHSLSHVRHDPAHCLAPGLFRALKRGERKRRQRVREALPELVALGWTVTEFAAGKYDITRPKAAG